MQNIILYFMIFASYSFLGWCLEVICKFFEYKRFINRGFLIGPVCPIYGFGGLFITILLEKYTADPLALFVFACILCGILEYMTSFVMEKIFHARWWDYSTRKFNINGRICLNTLIPFGLFGLLCMYFINPFLYNIFNSFDTHTFNIIALIIFIVILTDALITTFVLIDIRKENKVLDKDNTEEMNSLIHKRLKDRGYLQRRLLDAFPTVRHIGIVLEKERKTILNHLRKRKTIINPREEKIRARMKEKLELLSNEYNLKKKSIEERTEKKINKLRKKK